MVVVALVVVAGSSSSSSAAVGVSLMEVSALELSVIVVVNGKSLTESFEVVVGLFVNVYVVVGVVGVVVVSFVGELVLDVVAVVSFVVELVVGDSSFAV